jgi:predicted Zn-dependent protease with MMP-like domain
MQTLRVRSRVGSDGNLQLKLPEQFANQEIDVVLVYQSVEPNKQPNLLLEKDPLIGLFSGSPDLATRSEEILEKEINQTSGWTWK